MSEDTRPVWRGAAEAIGVLGVIGSLIFVALEIRQNTNAVRSATIQAISQQSYDANYRLAENSELVEIISKADNGEALTDSERRRLFAWWTAILRLNENRLQQYRLGVLDASILFDVGGRNRVYQGNSFAEYWESRKQDYSAEFQRFIDECVVSSCEAVPDR